jgi:hypothetical protein
MPEPNAPREVPAAVQAGLAAIQAQRRSWYTPDPDRYWRSAQRSQQDADSLRGNDRLATATAGADRVHLVVGNAADGSQGDIVRLSDLQIKLGGGWRAYGEWLTKRRLEVEALIKELGQPEAGEPAAGEIAKLRSEHDRLAAAAGRFGTHPAGRAAGSLVEPERLAAEVRRMLADPRSAALAREFAARWLRFRGFAERAPVDRGSFPEFAPELQADMEAEATAFLADLFRRDRPLRELFDASHAFLNERLAAHYGISGVAGPEFRGVKVANHGRGVLPTDLPLVESLRDRILEEDAGFSAAVLGIVQSRQFLNRRGLRRGSPSPRGCPAS